MKRETIFIACAFLFLIMISSASAVPKWTGGTSNATATTPKINDVVLMSVNLAADALTNLSSYTFSWNNSGVWVNDSPVNINFNNSFTVSAAKTVTLAGKPQIGWRVFFNDSANSKNATDVFVFNVANTPPAAPTSLSLSPDRVFKNSVITAVASGASDVDGDGITTLYQFRDSDDATILQAFSTNNTFDCGKSALCSVSDTIFVHSLSSTSDANSTHTTATSKINSKLSIDDISVTVDGRTDSHLQNGNTVDREVRPLSKIEVKVKMKNEFTTDEDLDINDISTTVTIRDIADGDDLEEESAEFDLSADRTRTLLFNFNVPIEVEEGTFDINIDSDGRDDNGTRQATSSKIRLVVEKKDDDVRILKAELFPDTIDCSRNTQLSLDIVNFGREDYGPDQSRRVLLRVENQQLGLGIRTDNIFLSDDLTSDESHYKPTYQIIVPSSLAAGTYPILVKVDYGVNFANTVSETATLTVNKCSTATQQNATPPVVVVQPPVTQPITPSTGVTAAQPSSGLLSKDNLYILLLVLANLVLLGIGIALIVKLARR